MFIELVDVLRCPRPHGDNYLVAAPQLMVDRHITDGTLGCPECGAEFQIRNGVTFLGEDWREAHAESPSEYEALRCAALLDLQGPGGLAILSGEWCTHAPLMLDPASVHLVLLNPPLGIDPAPGLSIVIAPESLPFASGCARGVALDIRTAERQVSIGAGLVKSGGRLVAPVDVPLPASARLLASDDRHWVAEVNHAPLATISLRRAGR